MLKRILSFFRPSLARRASKNEKRYKKWIGTLTPPPGAEAAALRLVYTDREGCNYYVFSDPLLMSVERSEKISEAVIAASLNIDKKRLSGIIARTMAAINSGDMAQIRGKALRELGDLRHRLDRIGVEALVLEIAALFFITDNENPYHVNPLTTAEKRRRALLDDDLRAFFLSTIWEIYRKPDQISGADFLEYVSSQKMKMAISKRLQGRS